jgi:hypothetical protein
MSDGDALRTALACDDVRKKARITATRILVESLRFEIGDDVSETHGTFRHTSSHIPIRRFRRRHVTPDRSLRHGLHFHAPEPTDGLALGVRSSGGRKSGVLDLSA